MKSEPILSLSAAVVRAPEQVSSELDGEVMLMSIESGKYFHLNPVGSRIWELIENPVAVSAIVAQLMAEFEVTREECQTEALAFLARLQTDRLLRVS